MASFSNLQYQPVPHSHSSKQFNDFQGTSQSSTPQTVSEAYNQLDWSQLEYIQSDLMLAANTHDTKTLNSLLSPFIQAQNFGLLDHMNALQWACFVGDTNLVRVLVNMGCNLSQIEPMNCETPIFFAIKGARFEIMKYLIECGGIELLTHRNRTQMTPFLTAASEFPEDCLPEILAMLEYMYLQGVSLEEQDEGGQTAIFWAAKRGSVNIVQWLVARGANMNHRDHMGNTVLHTASSNGDSDTMLFLCEFGAIRLLEARSIEDERNVGRSVYKICIIRRHFLLFVSLLKWSLQYKLFGFVRIFRSMYAWYYWFFVAANVILFLHLSSVFNTLDYNYSTECWLWIILFSLTQCFWTLVYFSDPGYERRGVIKPQFNSVFPNLADIHQQPVASLPDAGPQINLMRQCERKKLAHNVALIELNRACFSNYVSSAQDQLYRSHTDELINLKFQVNNLMSAVAKERRQSLPHEYVNAVILGQPDIKSVCVTCHIVKPARVHHCADCAHCIRREDHHCVWIDNCVGLHNQRSFWLFLLLLCFTFIWSFYLLAVYLITFASQFHELPWILFGLAIGVLFNGMLFPFVAYLLGRTTRSMVTNVTFYEHLKKPRHIVTRFKGEVSSLFWDMKDLTFVSFWKNIFGFWTLNRSLDDYYNFQAMPTSTSASLLHPYHSSFHGAMYRPVPQVGYHN